MGAAEILVAFSVTFPCRITVMLLGKVSGVKPKKTHCHLVVIMHHYTNSKTIQYHLPVQESVSIFNSVFTQVLTCKALIKLY